MIVQSTLPVFQPVTQREGNAGMAPMPACRHGKPLDKCVAAEHNGMVAHTMASPRAMALSHASARRELWREHRGMPTARLQRELQVHSFHLTDYCRPYRSENLRKVPLWYIRMIMTELRMRGVL